MANDVNKNQRIKFLLILMYARRYTVDIFILQNQKKCFHLTSTDTEAAAERLLSTLHRKRHMPESYEPVHEISNNVVCATSKASDQPAHTRCLIRAFACRLNILLLLSY